MLDTSKGLYDDELDCLARRMLLGTQVTWLGVFARDEPSSEQELLRNQWQPSNRPFALVLNNQPASEPGQHWLAIYGAAAPGAEAAALKRGGAACVRLHIEIEFFDSYALPQSAYSLHSALPSVVVVRYSRYPLQ